jgi:hypothetical protein
MIFLSATFRWEGPDEIHVQGDALADMRDGRTERYVIWVRLNQKGHILREPKVELAPSSSTRGYSAPYKENTTWRFDLGQQFSYIVMRTEGWRVATAITENERNRWFYIDQDGRRFEKERRKEGPISHVILSGAEDVFTDDE